MKRHLAPALVAALLLGACSTFGGNTRLNEGRAIAASYSALNAAYVTADTLAKAGTLHGAQAATVKSDLDQAKASLDAAETIYRLNPSADVSSQLTSAAALISQVLAITQAAK